MFSHLPCDSQTPTSVPASGPRRVQAASSWAFYLQGHQVGLSAGVVGSPPRHSPVGIVRDVEVLCGKVKYPTNFLVLGSVQDSFFPIIFSRPFLSTCGAIIDCKKGKVSVEFNGEPYEFNFFKFSKQPHGIDLSSNDKIIEEIASIAYSS